MFTLVIQSIWHGIIGAVVFLNTPDNRITPSMDLVHVDQYVFFITIGVFVAIHIALLSWLYLVPLKHRKNMARTGLDYERTLSMKKSSPKRISIGTKPPDSPPFARIPIQS